MTELVEYNKSNEYIFPCDCHHPGHYLRISADGVGAYLWIEYVQGLPRWRDRIRAALNCLLGREYTSGEVIINEAAARNLRTAIDEVLP
jgi:hypothetical protein